MMRTALAGTISLLVGAATFAAPVTYNVDPDHTYPAFETDHFGGLSVWRGKVNSTSGKVVLDAEAKTGTVEVTMDMKTIDFGHEKMNGHASSPDMLDVAKFPTATYKGTLGKFNATGPTEVQGELTMHGVTKPVVLKINTFKCIVHPMSKKDVCGADAEATINREDFGISYGKQLGFSMAMKLRISIEAVKAS